MTVVGPPLTMAMLWSGKRHSPLASTELEGACAFLFGILLAPHTHGDDTPNACPGSGRDALGAIPCPATPARVRCLSRSGDRMTLPNRRRRFGQGLFMAHELPCRNTRGIYAHFLHIASFCSR